MNFQEFKKLVIAACEEAGVAEYELYYQAGSSTSVDTFQHSINEFTSQQTGGIHSLLAGHACEIRHLHLRLHLCLSKINPHLAVTGDSLTGSRDLRGHGFFCALYLSGEPQFF